MNKLTARIHRHKYVSYSLKEAGISYGELIEKLIDLAIERFEDNVREVMHKLTIFFKVLK